jgi:hypothetical protein
METDHPKTITVPPIGFQREKMGFSRRQANASSSAAAVPARKRVEVQLAIEMKAANAASGDDCLQWCERM